MSLLASAEIRALLEDAAGRAGRYLAGLDERPVAPDDAALALGCHVRRFPSLLTCVCW